MILNVIFRLLLTFNATSLLVIIFLVHKKYTLDYFCQDVPALQFSRPCAYLISYALYLMIPLFLTGLSLWLSNGLGRDAFRKGEVTAVEHANNSFLPSYLGYFFVALSISNWSTLFIVYGLLFIFTFLSQALYFNPLFLVYGYEFYNVRTRSGASIFLISRYQYKTPDEINISSALRINNYTFIERK
ncbi:hypothetical protein QN095_02365 [Enterobacter cloacae]|uniref:hypothetical protein n=1 Tax=Enterobacter cloacae TaxID=550 RepID=UPI0025402CE5|nr:hypothetical protein [Enterobacter cloacae]WIF62945.1 hypothetical protein QN095_02365 [Enterobacter cloacae]